MLSIIIPYRDRLAHLELFLKNTVESFKSLPAYEIIVVHQCDDQLFNRGALINIGVGHCSNESTYIVTQDVDTIPKPATVQALYAKAVAESEIESIYSNPKTLGGVVKLQKATFELIGGFPNNFWGWGAEDKALQNRAELKGLTIRRNLRSNQPEKEIAQFFELHKESHVRVTTNARSNIDKEFRHWNALKPPQRLAHIQRDGTVQTVEYKLLSQSSVEHDAAAFAKIKPALGQSDSSTDPTSTHRVLLLNVSLCV